MLKKVLTRYNLIVYWNCNLFFYCKNMSIRNTVGAWLTAIGLSVWWAQVADARDRTQYEIGTIIKENWARQTVRLVPGCNTVWTWVSWTVWPKVNAETWEQCVVRTFEERKEFDRKNPDNSDNNWWSIPTRPINPWCDDFGNCG